MKDLLNEFIGVLIRLSVIYVLLGLVCAFVAELYSWIRRWRHRFLKQAISRALGNALQERFFHHYLIAALGPFPSYIPLWLFPVVVADLVLSPAQEADNNEFQTAIALLRDREANQPDGDKLIESWFKSILESSSDRYRARVRNLLLALALFLTIVFRLDTIHVINESLAKQLGAANSPLVTQSPLMEWLLHLSSFLESSGLGYLVTAILICTGSIIAFNLLSQYAPLRGRWTGK
jgi:hypothetical protein